MTSKARVISTADVAITLGLTAAACGGGDGNNNGGDPTLKSHSDDVVVGATRMASIVTAVAPFDNVDCRKAVSIVAREAS